MTQDKKKTIDLIPGAPTRASMRKVLRIVRASATLSATSSTAANTKTILVHVVVGDPVYREKKNEHECEEVIIFN